MNLSMRQKQTQTYRTDFWLPRERKGRGGLDWDFETRRCELLYIGWINNKVLLCSTGNQIQYPVINQKIIWKRTYIYIIYMYKMYIYVWITFLYTRNYHNYTSIFLKGKWVERSCENILVHIQIKPMSLVSPTPYFPNELTSYKYPTK